MATEKTFTETMKVTGENLLDTVKRLLHEGNVRKIQIVDKNGKNVFDFPMTFGIVGALISAPLAILATLIVLAKEYTIKVERTEDKPTKRLN
jgi:hypothetical protein